ncbi:hypothetical protein [Streptomyces sp. NPDC002851]
MTVRNEPFPEHDRRAAPPPGEGEWDIRFANGEAAKGSEHLSSQAPGNTLTAWQTTHHPTTGRAHRAPPPPQG